MMASMAWIWSRPLECDSGRRGAVRVVSRVTVLDPSMNDSTDSAGAASSSFDSRRLQPSQLAVLVVHNFYQQPGGEDQVFKDEIELLRSRGHAVTTFTVHN